MGLRCERQVQVSNNITHPGEKKAVVGGTAMAGFGDAISSNKNQVSDTKKLMCWLHMSITGKNDIITTFIICYCPMKGASPGSVCAQILN